MPKGNWRVKKKILISDLYLSHFDPKLDIILVTEASDNGIGVVLLQKYDDESKMTVANVSQLVLPPEKNSNQIEKGALTIIFNMKKFYRFIHRWSFCQQTDHWSLLSIYGSNKGIPIHTNSK